MDIEPLTIAGGYVVTPRQFPDERGVFLESFRGDHLAAHLGHRPDIVQTNVSVSSRGTVRGIHFADVPPGQGKYVTVLAGSLVDYVVDIRVGSPTFGRWEAVTLDAVDRRAVYLAEGLGHAFCALEDGTTAMYLCTATYNPTAEHGIHPLDPEVGLALPAGIDPLLSPKDDAAPSLAVAVASGRLPTDAGCRAWADELAQGGRGGSAPPATACGQAGAERWREPASDARSRTAAATASATPSWNTDGTMWSTVGSGTRSAMAWAAASFIASVIWVAPASRAPRKMPGNASTLLIWFG